MVKKPLSKKGGVWQRLLDALFKRMGKIVPNDELMKVSGQHNYARRLRELRAEGWDVAYNASAPQGYVLRSAKKLPKETDAYINLKLRLKVLERDTFTCQLCGHKGKEKFADEEVVRLEVDHILPLNQGGKTIEQNLWTLCSRCNAGKKSLLSYPETMKNRIISLNLPDELRMALSNLSAQSGRSINDLLLDAINRGLEKLK